MSIHTPETRIDTAEFCRLDRDTMTWFREARERLSVHHRTLNIPSDQENRDV